MPSFSKFFSTLTGSQNSSSSTSLSQNRSSQNFLKSSSNLSALNKGEYSSSEDIDFYHTTNCNVVNPNHPIKVTVAVETPPLILYSNPSESSGAFFSGTFILDIFLDSKSKNPNLVNKNKLEPMMSISKLSNNQLIDDYVILKNVSIYLIQVTKYGKPFLPNSNTLQSCKDCRKKTVELARWEILTKKTAFVKGSSHSCPFSHVIPGNIPPTTILSNINTSIKYELIAKVTYLDKDNKSNIINLSQPLMITRSFLREQDKNSTRIFPPTDVSSTAVIPNVIYPRSTFPVEIRMDNVSTPKRRWRMKKLNWRVEETVCVKSNHCDLHTEKFNQTIEITKNQKKSAKISKNSGGLGHSNINHFFGVPKKNLNNNNNSIDNNNNNRHPNDDTILNNNNNRHPNDDTILNNDSNNALAPQASNWLTNINSLNSLNIEPSNSGSLDQILSSNNNLLSNPDEIVLSSIPEKLPDPVMYIEEIRTISSGELKSGWKSDFSGKGRIELVVEVSLMNLISMGFNNSISYNGPITSKNCNSPFKSNYLYESENSDCNCSTDIEDKELGIYVTHNLILEVVIAEELMQSTLASSNIVNNNKTGTSISSNSTAAIATGNLSSQSRIRPVQRSRTTLSEDDFPDVRVGPQASTGNKSDVNNHVQGIPTGIARVLRMQFKVILCERSGHGVAWDDEVPPIYPVVGALSPPNYHEATNTENPVKVQDFVVPLEEDSDLCTIEKLEI